MIRKPDIAHYRWLNKTRTPENNGKLLFRKTSKGFFPLRYHLPISSTFSLNKSKETLITKISVSMSILIEVFFSFSVRLIRLALKIVYKMRSLNKDIHKYP